jgi:hypothetical protein
MMGHEASTLASEYGPQWMNIPNLASLNRLNLSAEGSAAAHNASGTRAARTKREITWQL